MVLLVHYYRHLVPFHRYYHLKTYLLLSLSQASSVSTHGTASPVPLSNRDHDLGLARITAIWQIALEACGGCCFAAVGAAVAASEVENSIEVVVVRNGHGLSGLPGNAGLR
jgi:hypothetical protein